MPRLLVLSLSVLVLAACSARNGNSTAVAPDVSNRTPADRPARPTLPHEDVVSAIAGDVSLPAGGSAEMTVRLRIADGYHVNANPPTDKFYIGTELRVTPQDGIEPGSPIYPAAVNKAFGFSPRPLAVYENDAVIKLPLKAAGTTAKGKHELSAVVRAQPCNDEQCLPPRNVKVTLPVTVN